MLDRVRAFRQAAVENAEARGFTVLIKKVWLVYNEYDKNHPDAYYDLVAVCSSPKKAQVVVEALRLEAPLIKMYLVDWRNKNLPPKYKDNTDAEGSSSQVSTIGTEETPYR